MCSFEPSIWCIYLAGPAIQQVGRQQKHTLGPADIHTHTSKNVETFPHRHTSIYIHVLISRGSTEMSLGYWKCVEGGQAFIIYPSRSFVYLGRMKQGERGRKKRNLKKILWVWREMKMLEEKERWKKNRRTNTQHCRKELSEFSRGCTVC